MWLVVDKTLIVSVAVDESVYQTDKPYDYLVPDFLRTKAHVGCRVLVPFGKGNLRKTGIIIAISDNSPTSKIKYVISVLDETPVLDEKMLKLAYYIKSQTFCSLYNAIRVLLPPGINFKVKNTYSLTESADSMYDSLTKEQKQTVDYMRSVSSAISKDAIYNALGFKNDCGVLERLVSKGVTVKYGDAVRSVGDASQKMVRLTDAASDTNIKLTPKQKQVITVLNEVGCCSVKEICYFTGLTSAVTNGLAKKGVVEIFEQEYYRNPYENVGIKETAKINLTETQSRSYNELLEAYKSQKGVTALLYGVTGSGKTQVFLKLCEEVASSGRGVIVMVPEIALTPQTLGVFHRRFGSKVAVFHSAMSQGQRLDEWKRVKRGEVSVAVGTRSAVFAPFADVGLIIMDEEHEHTYKSEMSPHFHARDIAKYRIAESKGLLVLSSATPSLESYSLALSGKYLLSKLGERYGTADLPQVEIVDMRKELQAGNNGIISNLLYDRINECLKSKKQAILLLNRRGFNTYVSCPQCGNVLSCDNCSISMTYHSANNRLLCHYCGKSVPYVDKCPVCGCDRMKYSGLGTQRAETELAALFPEAKILRMDADSTMTRSDYEKHLKSFSNGEYDILLGTQMVAKGLDFPKVTVVGVLNADSSMHNSDYRCFERTFSLLTQVVGRSGRGDSKGTAVIQTNEPDNRIIELAAKQDYETFYETEILTRKLMTYPPYCNIAAICFSGADRHYTENAAKSFVTLLKTAVTSDYKAVKIVTLGPTASAVPKVNNMYRYKLIIKYKNSAEFRKMLNEVYALYMNSHFSKKVSSFIDVNPDSII
jgi:primosomal protein N' (replication factor Y)